MPVGSPERHSEDCMGIDVYLEADNKLTDQALATALEGAGAVLIDRDAYAVEAGEWRGWFSESGLSFNVSGPRSDPRIRAEDPKHAEFSVGRTCVFRLRNAEYDKNIRDLERVLHLVADTTGAHFVVSFQLEQTMYVYTGGTIQEFD